MNTASTAHILKHNYDSLRRILLGLTSLDTYSGWFVNKLSQKWIMASGYIIPKAAHMNFVLFQTLPTEHEIACTLDPHGI